MPKTPVAEYDDYDYEEFRDDYSKKKAKKKKNHHRDSANKYKGTYEDKEFFKDDD